MSNTANIDLRQQSITSVKVQKTVKETQAIITWADIPTLDTGYTLEVAGQTYTVGSGLTLDAPTSSVSWTINTNALTVGKYEGTLISDSEVVGVRFVTKIKLEVE